MMNVIGWACRRCVAEGRPQGVRGIARWSVAHISGDIVAEPVNVCDEHRDEIKSEMAASGLLSETVNCYPIWGQGETR